MCVCKFSYLLIYPDKIHISKLPNSITSTIAIDIYQLPMN